MVAAIEGALTKQTEPNRRACGRISDMPNTYGLTHLRLTSSIYGSTVLFMEPTFDVPEELLVRAKSGHRPRAAAGQLRFLVTEGLRGQLAGPPTPARRRRIRWVTAAREGSRRASI